MDSNGESEIKNPGSCWLKGRCLNMRLLCHLIWLLAITPWPAGRCSASEIIMITMGGTKSHKIPFWELARGLIERDHKVTFVSAFPADFHLPGLEEVAPARLVFYVRNYTNWDLVGAKFKGEEPVSVYDLVRYSYEACDAFLEDHETQLLIQTRKQYDLFILDGAFPECALGIVDHFKVPFIYINTVAFYTGSISNSGSPTPYSITPFVTRAFTDNMGLADRVANTGWHLMEYVVHSFTMNILLQDVLRKHFGPTVPYVYDLGKNVSLILQNGHYTVTYPRAYLPNVVEIACIHCKPAKALSKELEDFINQGGENGFIFVSMGSSVKTSNMPDDLRKLLVRTFSRLPYQILWKWKDDARAMTDLPQNIMLSRWLPQQDLLGHKKIRAFVTHGGLLSMFETVYHGVPVVSMPVFCDHESNAAKAELDGYAVKLDLYGLTSENLFNAITEVIHVPKYREEVKRRQFMLKDQKETPLEMAIYWTEYVIRHKGAKHLLSPARDFNFIQFYSIDTTFILMAALLFLISTFAWLLKASFRYLLDHYPIPRKVKGD